MGHHAVLTLVEVAGGYHDHLTLGNAQVARFFHQGIMVGKEGAKLLRPMRQHQKHIGHKTGLFLHRQNAITDILRHIGQLRHRKTADGMLRYFTHFDSPDCRDSIVGT